ncbi:MAG: hypothetical protein ACTSQJ_07835 [Promethearchaeota archaeon]
MQRNAKKKSQQPIVKKTQEISGSITIGEKLKKKTPWILGNKIRKPKMYFPKFKHRKLSIPMPAKTLGIIIIFILLGILQTGIVYLLYKEPPALGAKPNGDPIFLYPSIHDQFIVEGIVASILIFCCSIGYIFLYQASKYVYNRKMALRILIIGFILIFVAFVALQYMIMCKVTPSKCK